MKWIALALAATGCCSVKSIEPHNASNCSTTTTFMEGGQKFVHGTVGFPTGRMESSGLLLEKTVPVEVLAGRPFSYEYRIVNLLDCPIAEVTVVDRVSGDFQSPEASPRPDSVLGEVATWKLGTLGPREARVIKVTGQVLAEGTITTCGWATYTPALCAPVRIIKPVNAILVEVVDDPDPIQVGESTTYTIRVTNQGGNTPLEDVAVVALFPGGLTPSAPSNDGTIDGQTVRWRPVTIAVRRAVAYTVKGMGTRNSRWSDLRVEVTTKGRERPIYELEATSVY